MPNNIVQKKVSLLGEFATGKTSLVRRFVYNIFDERYMSTLGVNISRKEIGFADLKRIHMLIWDLSGNEKFDGARSDYIRGTSGALLVCDLTRAETVSKLSYFKNYLYEFCPNIPAILIGNKADLIPDGYKTVQQLETIAKECNFPYKITSAKKGIEVDSAFIDLAELMVS